MTKPSAQEQLMKLMNKNANPKASSVVKSSSRPSFNFSIQTANQLLLIGIIVCAVVLVIEMRSGFNLLNQTVDLADDTRPLTSGNGLIAPVLKPANYYLDNIKSRNIFKPYESVGNLEASSAQQDLAKKMSKYKLVGVAWLDLPETASVLIEDTQTHTTLFLKQGEQLDGITVKTIYTDRAVFGYENEEITIKL